MSLSVTHTAHMIDFSLLLPLQLKECTIVDSGEVCASFCAQEKAVKAKGHAVAQLGKHVGIVVADDIHLAANDEEGALSAVSAPTNLYQFVSHCVVPLLCHPYFCSRSVCDRLRGARHVRQNSLLPLVKQRCLTHRKNQLITPTPTCFYSF